MKLKEYLEKKERNYKDEYEKFQSSKKQKQDRALRNNARRNSNCKKGDGKEIDHILPLAKNGTNDKSNQRVVLQHTNRVKGKK